MDDKKINARQVWAKNRFQMESENLKSKRYGGKTHHHWYFFLSVLTAVLEMLMKLL